MKDKDDKLIFNNDLLLLNNGSIVKVTIKNNEYIGKFLNKELPDIILSKCCVGNKLVSARTLGGGLL